MADKNLFVDNSHGVQIGNNTSQINIFTINQQSPEYQKLKEELNKAKRNFKKDPKDPDFIKDLQEVQKKHDEFIEFIRKLYAEINTLELNSARGKKAKEYFFEGNYQAAREELNIKEMSEEKQYLLEKKKQLEEISMQLSELAKEYILKARLTSFDFQLGDQRIPMTRQYFEEAIELNEIPEHLFAYAFFLHTEEIFSDAEERYYDALTLCSNLVKNDQNRYLPGLGYIYQELGNIKCNDGTHHYDKAEEYLREAVKIFHDLAMYNQDGYCYVEASLLSNLGLLIGNDPNRFDEARELFQSAVKIYENKGTLDSFSYALVINNFAKLLLENNRIKHFGEAEKFLKEASDIFCELTKNDQTIVLLQSKAMTCVNLGNLIKFDYDRHLEAEDYLKKALTIYRNIDERYPFVYQPDIASTLSSLAEAHILWDQPKASIPYLRDSIKLLSFLAKRAPQKFEQTLILNKEYLQAAISEAAIERKKTKKTGKLKKRVGY